MEPQVDHAALCGAVLLLTLGVASGCASSRISDQQPRTPADVNEQLEDRWARIEQTDGRRIEHVEDVQMGPDNTTFYHRFDQEHRALPTASVRTVPIRGETGHGRRLLTGAAPGVMITFMGGAVAVTNSGDESGGIGIGAALGVAMAAGGTVLGVLGGTIGAIVGGAASEDEWVTIYEGPATRYQRGP